MVRDTSQAKTGIEMSTNLDIIEEINKHLDDRYGQPGSFETFVLKLQTFGIVRFSFDTLKSEMSFYSIDQLIHTHIRSEVKIAKEQLNWQLCKTFEIPILEQAITDLDEGKIGAVEFHHQMHKAGVVFCMLYLIPRKIFYMSQDGSFYLEHY